ncbi:MAG: hypothetical protein M1814_006557 [Vezdaea aestivalis]|nr:MAG: hypothetical protein M1814_006557 [Vezdaea aestivalis]
MAPPPTQTPTPLLSPAELSYTHTSLLLQPPIRPDLRSATQFRPLVAETDVLPSTNGSARVCAADGAEAVVGVKAETMRLWGRGEKKSREGEKEGGDVVVVDVEVPGQRDDDALPVFLSGLLVEGLKAGGLHARGGINGRWRWRFYIDVLLLSPPATYPLPLLSLTLHLALLSTRLPALLSTGDEDPLFSDDWAAATPLYPPTSPQKPPITLLILTVGDNILFDPAPAEIAVAEGLIAITVAGDGRGLLGVRMVDPPGRGVEGSVPRGGIKRAVIKRVLELVLAEGGIAGEVLEGLRGLAGDEK